MTKRIAKTTAIIVCTALLLGCVTALVVLHCWQKSDSYVCFDKGKLKEVYPNVKVLDANGEEIKDTVAFGERKQIPLSDLHDYTYMAFVAVEDKRFFSHNGLDAKRIAGAALNNIKSGSFKEGASTISQQLIKNTHLSNEKTVSRKLNEMLLAVELENNFSKKEILEMYLNTIYFGRNAYGIESAANVYFDKSAADLTLSESAVLAGMIKAPNIYAPDKNADKCKSRRDTVLKLMLDQQIISKESFDTALCDQIDYRPFSDIKQKSYVSLAVDEACKLLNMTVQQLCLSGAVVETWFDPYVQRALEQFAASDQTQNKDGSLCDLSCVILNDSFGVSGCYFRGESALTKKQIGSTAKPIAVYTPALCEGLITQASPVLDEPTTFGGYAPQNAGGYEGWTTVKNAVAKSLNIPAVKTLNTLGIGTSQKYLKRLGFEGEQNLSLALGNIEGGMNILQLAKCYGTLQQGGTTEDVTFVKCVRNGRSVVQHKRIKSKVYDSKSAFLMTDMLQNAAQMGTARQLKKTNLPVAAKTGTVGNTKGNSDALLAAYTPDKTFVFWYSGDLPNSINGATTPCTLAANVLKSVYQKGRPQDFPVPKGIEKIGVNREMLYQEQIVEADSLGESFWFDVNNKPKVRKVCYNYRLSVSYRNGEISFVLPQMKNKTWQIYKYNNGQWEEFEQKDVTDGMYCAKLFEKGLCVYTTPQVKVVMPTVPKTKLLTQQNRIA